VWRFFAGNHGVVRRGVSAYPAEVTRQMVKNFIDGGAAINQLCRAADAELRVYEMALETPTEDFTRAPALDDEECMRAIAYGMAAVEPGLDILALGEMGIGNTTSAAALALALFGGTAEDWTGPGTGVVGAALRGKIETVAVGVERHRDRTDPLQLLAALGGRELAAIVGAILAARMARVPGAARRLRSGRRRGCRASLGRRLARSLPRWLISPPSRGTDGC
jgi:nicotinate-nucleotide--dimethylbenzimidazole phosphoribosyltransferase